MIDAKGYAQLLRLARSWGAGPDAADLVQDTVLKLLEKAPPAGAEPLAYATAVLRNRVRKRFNAVRDDKLTTLDAIKPNGETYQRHDDALIVAPEQERWLELADMARDVRRLADRRSLMVAHAPAVLESLVARPLRGDRREAVDVRRALRLHATLGSWAKVARQLVRRDGHRFTYAGICRAVQQHRQAGATT